MEDAVHDYLIPNSLLQPPQIAIDIRTADSFDGVVFVTEGTDLALRMGAKQVVRGMAASVPLVQSLQNTSVRIAGESHRQAAIGSRGELYFNWKTASSSPRTIERERPDVCRGERVLQDECRAAPKNTSGRQRLG